MNISVYLIVAFAAAWAVTFIYVLALLRRQKRLQRDVDMLKEAARGKSTD